MPTDEVPLDQLKRIAGIIDEAVRTELDRARMRLRQDWDVLKAAEEGKDLNAPSVPGVPLAAGASIRPLPVQMPDRTSDDIPAFRRLRHAYVEDDAREESEIASDDPKPNLLPPDILMDFNAPIPHPLDNQTTKTSVQKPRPRYYPKGIYHRLISYSTFGRRRATIITSSSTGPRLALSGRRIIFPRILSKRTVFVKCYALCSLARVLLGRKTSLQERVETAVSIVLAKKANALAAGLQMAWKLAGVVEDEGLESEGEGEAV